MKKLKCEVYNDFKHEIAKLFKLIIEEKLDFIELYYLMDSTGKIKCNHEIKISGKQVKVIPKIKQKITEELS